MCVYIHLFPNWEDSNKSKIVATLGFDVELRVKKFVRKIQNFAKTYAFGVGSVLIVKAGGEGRIRIKVFGISAIRMKRQRDGLVSSLAKRQFLPSAALALGRPCSQPIEAGNIASQVSAREMVSPLRHSPIAKLSKGLAFGRLRYEVPTLVNFALFFLRADRIVTGIQNMFDTYDRETCRKFSVSFLRKRSRVIEILAWKDVVVTLSLTGVCTAFRQSACRLMVWFGFVLTWFFCQKRDPALEH
jgi:hypothetical protein